MGIMQYITSFNGLAGRKQKKTMRHTGPPSPHTTTRGFTSRDRYTAKEKGGWMMVGTRWFTTPNGRAHIKEYGGARRNAKAW